MFTAELFLGLPLDPALERALLLANPHMRAMFINNGSDYLHQAQRGSQKYLGKHLGKMQEISSIDLAEANIRSLVTKLVPKFIFRSELLELFPVQVE